MKFGIRSVIVVAISFIFVLGGCDLTTDDPGPLPGDEEDEPPPEPDEYSQMQGPVEGNAVALSTFSTGRFT